MAVRNTYDHENGPHSVHGFRTGRFDFGINTTFIIYRLGETLIDAGPTNQRLWQFLPLAMLRI